MAQNVLTDKVFKLNGISVRYRCFELIASVYFVHLKTSLDHGDSCQRKICLCLLERGKAAQHFINHWVCEPHIQ